MSAERGVGIRLGRGDEAVLCCFAVKDGQIQMVGMEGYLASSLLDEG
jgi:hypothetical protein